MKLWKRWTAAVLAAAMALLLLAACGPSGPSAPDAPDKPGSSEPGKDPTDETTEAQKVAAVVEALNTVRKNYGNNTPLKLNEQACEFAKKMVGEKTSIGFGALQGDYPDANQFKTWAVKTEGVSAERNNKLVKSKEATLVGVGVVQNTDEKTKDKYPIMVVVMTY